MKIFEEFTYSTVLIKVKHNNGNSGTGTGFLTYMCHNIETNTARLVLVTNKHVIAGAVEIVFSFATKDDDSNVYDRERYEYHCYRNRWIPHPDDEVDLCCLDITQDIMNNINNFKFKLESKQIFYSAIKMSHIPTKEEIQKWDAVEDLYMIGYPNSIIDKYNYRPIVRKGISATHIKNDFDGKCEFLIDMACFPGSSGSPVFALIDFLDIQNNTISHGKKMYFVGVLYSGPQHIITGQSYEGAESKIYAKIPNNLGFVIKSSKLKNFEQILYELYP